MHGNLFSKKVYEYKTRSNISLFDDGSLVWVKKIIYKCVITMMNYNAAILNGECLQRERKGIKLRECNLATTVEKRLDYTCVLLHNHLFRA